MKKTILVTLLVATLLLFAVGCAKKAGDAMEDKDGDAMEDKDEPAPAPEPAPAQAEAPVEAAPSTTEAVTGLTCGEGKVSFTLNNVGAADWVIAEQRFFLNDVPDKDPECGQETLAPGESTVCSLDSLFLHDRKNAVSFQGADGARGTKSELCP